MWPFKKKEKHPCYHGKDSSCCDWKIRPYMKFSKDLNWLFTFGINEEIIQFEGKPYGPKPTWEIGFSFNRNKLLDFGIDHIYYDGPHCIYKFGPISFYKIGIGWCKKCSSECC